MRTWLLTQSRHTWILSTCSAGCWRGSDTVQLGVQDFEIHLVSRTFPDFYMGFYISGGFLIGFLDLYADFWIYMRISNFALDFWISCWISGFLSGFLNHELDRDMISRSPVGSLDTALEF